MQPTFRVALLLTVCALGASCWLWSLPAAANAPPGCMLDRLGCAYVCEGSSEKDVTVGSGEWNRCWPDGPRKQAERRRIEEERARLEEERAEARARAEEERIQNNSLTWEFDSNSSSTVHMKLYSQNRRHVWPSADQVWVLDGVHTFPITCVKGEKICYGAWPEENRRLYWGCGPDCRQRCTDCCYTCGSGTTNTFTLND